MLIRNSGPMRKATPQKIAEARRLYLEDGLSWAAIAPRVGLSAATVRRWNPDCSRCPSQALELAWQMGRYTGEASEETRKKLSEAAKRTWAKVTDRGWLNRHKREYRRMMNA